MTLMMFQVDDDDPLYEAPPPPPPPPPDPRLEITPNDKQALQAKTKTGERVAIHNDKDSDKDRDSIVSKCSLLSDDQSCVDEPEADQSFEGWL